MIACIYLLTIRRDSALPFYYVGQTKNFSYRVRIHLYYLKKGKHPNRRMQFAFNKYGERALLFEPLEQFSCGIDLDPHEQWWLDEMVGHARVMNVALSPSGRMSEETKAKISLSLKGRTYTKKSGYKHSHHKGKGGGVRGVHIKTGEIIEFTSAKLAKKAGFNDCAISRCISGRQGYHRKYVWTRIT